MEPLTLTIVHMAVATNERIRLCWILAHKHCCYSSNPSSINCGRSLRIMMTNYQLIMLRSPRINLSSLRTRCFSIRMMQLSSPHTIGSGGNLFSISEPTRLHQFNITAFPCWSIKLRLISNLYVQARVCTQLRCQYSCSSCLCCWISVISLHRRAYTKYKICTRPPKKKKL